jgi:hypothetical protein
MKESKIRKVSGQRKEMWKTQTANVTSSEREEIRSELQVWSYLKEYESLVTTSRTVGLL